MRAYLFVLLISPLMASRGSRGDDMSGFEEQLTVWPLNDNLNYLIMFNYTIKQIDVAGGSADHYSDLLGIDAQELLELLAARNASMRAAIGAGRWMYGLWGDAGVEFNPMGVQLQLSSDGSAVINDELWNAVSEKTGSLLACQLSSDAMSPTSNTAKTTWFYSNPNELFTIDSMRRLLKHILPCGLGGGGLVGMMNIGLFRTPYHSLRLNVNKAGDHYSIELLFLAVFEGGDNGFRMQGISNAPLKRPCPAVDSSSIRFFTNDMNVVLTKGKAQRHTDDQWITFDLLSNISQVMLSDVVVKQDSKRRLPNTVEVNRFVIGSTVHENLLESHFKNHAGVDLFMKVTQYYPKGIKPLIHTIRLVNSKRLDAFNDQLELLEFEENKGTIMIRFSFRLPVEGRTISLLVRRDFQSWDANRVDRNAGEVDEAMRVPSMVVDVFRSENDTASWMAAARIWSRSQVLRKAIPDSSMPFNALCFTGTLFGVLYTTMFSVTCRPFADGQSNDKHQTWTQLPARLWSRLTAVVRNRSE